MTPYRQRARPHWREGLPGSFRERRRDLCPKYEGKQRQPKTHKDSRSVFPSPVGAAAELPDKKDETKMKAGQARSIRGAIFKK